MTTKDPKENKTIPVNVRWMISRHLDEMLAIENASVKPPEEPWTWDENFAPALHKRNVIGFVAELNEGENPGKVVGYMLYELQKDHIILLKMAVDPAYRRKSIGSQMMEKLQNKLSQQRRQHITVVINERDKEALDFLRKMGFRANGTIRNHYINDDGYEMLCSMERELFAPAADDDQDEKEQGSKQSKNKQSKAEAETSAATEHTNEDGIASEEKFTAPSRATIVTQMRQKLISATNMEWNVVKKNKRGKWVNATIEDYDNKEAEIYFQNCDNVTNGKNAYEAAAKIFAADIRETGNPYNDKADIIEIPCKWARPMHLQLGISEVLLKPFKPSDYRARIKLDVENNPGAER